MSKADRRLSAIMFTDIVGYTKLAQANESLSLELLEEHRKLVRPILERHNGREVKTIGDAFLVEFKSALEAVLCAVEIQEALSKRNSESEQSRKLDVRIGVHLGDVVHEAGDVYGDAVNVASRMQPLAEPGGICLSQQVYDNIRNKTELEVSKMGEVELKNVELPVAVYRVELQSKSIGSAIAPRERLAVLPFVNISPDPNDEFFADGLTEELITKLSEVKGLKVIARTSVMNYKKKEKSVSQIARELGVGTIVEGSVRKAGNRIRVTVQVIDSITEEHLWASNYDKELDDIFAIQTDVASRVASSVSAGIVTGVKKEEVGLEAYTLYIKGMQKMHEGTEPSLRSAMMLLQSAIARDPKFARAHAGLALTWQGLAVGGYEDYGVVSSKAEAAALKALELDPNSAEAHSAMAAVAMTLDRFEEAAGEAEEAVRINPNLAEGHLALGINTASMGRLQESLPSLERAHEVDPLSVRTTVILALVLNVSGNVDRAMAVLEKMNELNPGTPRVLAGIAECHMSRGDFDRAEKLLNEALRINPREGQARMDRGLLMALSGRATEAEEALRVIEEDSGEASVLYAQLFINAALGKNDEAFKAMKRMTQTHSWPFLVASLPVFAGLRKDPRYREFAAAVGLPV